MSAYHYRNGTMCAEEVTLSRVAEAVGTPVYCYSTAAIAAQYHAFSAALARVDATVCYALKANASLAVVSTLAALGAGADVVSEGELRRALAAGITADKIVFSGVGKTRDEMAAALDAGVGLINVESEPEIELLNEIAVARGKRAPAAIRVNPDVDPRTHAKITTGKSENKFGIDLRRARAIYGVVAALPGMALKGVAVHIGSQITELAPFREAFRHVAELVGELRADGQEVSVVDLGGGLGIAYDTEAPPSLADYGRIVEEIVAPLGCALVFEPGRYLVGNGGVLITRVLYVKKGSTRTFLIVDAAMNDFLRPALYDGYHPIVPVEAPAATVNMTPVDIVGPVCESGDTFARSRPLPPVAAGDLLAICSVGAYGAVMASNYNLRLQAPEVLVRGAEFTVARARSTHEELLERERLPDWLANSAGHRSRGAA